MLSFRKFHEKLEAGDRRAQRLQDLLGEADARIVKWPKEPHALKPGDTYSAKSLQVLSDRIPQDLFIAIIGMIREPGQLRASTAFALKDILLSHPEWKHEDVKACLKRISIGKMREDLAQRGAPKSCFAAALAHELTLHLGRGRV